MEKEYQSFKEEIEYLIAHAQNKRDLNFIGAKFNDAIDNKYNMDIWGYQLQAAKKMTEIYNKERKSNTLSEKFAESELEKVA